MNKSKQTQYGTGRFNVVLFRLRDKDHLTQEQFGKRIGYETHTIMRIENGISGGKLDFWQAIQKAYDIPSAAMWDLMLGNEHEFLMKIGGSNENYNDLNSDNFS